MMATFLDRQTGRIDVLIASKARLIELLQEKRRALIARAVTKGVDGNSLLKDSEVDWLGPIPFTWTKTRIRNVVTFQRGHDLPSDDRAEGEIPVVSSAGLSGMHSRAAAYGPGIVTGRYGTIGDFHLIETDYWPLNTTLYSTDLHRNEPRFIRYMLVHLSPLFLLNAVKSAVPGIDRNDIHPIPTVVPTLQEQKRIADHLDAQMRSIDKIIDRLSDGIERLNELRTALISAAVTGKIDVRGAVA